MRRRLKLCVGVNDYPGTGLDLAGCVNDATGWSRLLEGHGYVGPTLLDGEATKDEVVRLLRQMVDVARFADRIVFTYSGHGSYLPDVDGDEGDGRDECLVLHDFADGGLLTDDELHQIFSARRWGVRVVVISDSCHSGTAHRFVGDRAKVDARARFLPPSVLGVGPAVARSRSVSTSRPRPTTALLAGCREDEVAYDAWIDGRPQGAFTATALAAYVPGANLRQWQTAIDARFPRGRFDQHPELVATSSQRRWAL